MEIKPATHAKSESDMDALTIELKMMERLIKKEESRVRKEAERKANNAASQPKKKASTKESKPPALATSKKTLDSNKSAWTEYACPGCKKPFVTHKDWINPPNRCKACQEKLRNAKVYVGKKSPKTMFSNFVIYGGGAPGLGKR